MNFSAVGVMEHLKNVLMYFIKIMYIFEIFFFLQIGQRLGFILFFKIFHHLVSSINQISVGKFETTPDILYSLMILSGLLHICS